MVYNVGHDRVSKKRDRKSMAKDMRNGAHLREVQYVFYGFQPAKPVAHVSRPMLKLTDKRT